MLSRLYECFVDTLSRDGHTVDFLENNEFFVYIQFIEFRDLGESL